MIDDNLTEFVSRYKYSDNLRTGSQIMTKLNKGNTIYNVLLENATKFLDVSYNNISISHRLFHVWFEIYEVIYCPICGNPLKYSGKFSTNKNGKCVNYYKTCGGDICMRKITYENTKKAIIKKYGVDNISKLDFITKKKINTHLSHYGTEYPFQSENFKEKAKNTWMLKYGVACPLSSSIVRKKGDTTNLEKYGTIYPIQNKNVRNKAEATNLEKYGTIYPTQSPIVINKIKETNQKLYGVDWQPQRPFFIEHTKKQMMLKYGVEHNSQLTAHTQGYRWYDYVLPSTKTVRVQGYESKYLDEYFNNNYAEDNILIQNKDIESTIGKIWYYTSDGHKHRYFPDFYLIKENKIIEVKSAWTMAHNVDINELKKRACIKMGLNFEYKIY